MSGIVATMLDGTPKLVANISLSLTSWVLFLALSLSVYGMNKSYVKLQGPRHEYDIAVAIIIAAIFFIYSGYIFVAIPLVGLYFLYILLQRKVRF